MTKKLSKLQKPENKQPGQQVSQSAEGSHMLESECQTGLRVLRAERLRVVVVGTFTETVGRGSESGGWEPSTSLSIAGWTVLPGLGIGTAGGDGVEGSLEVSGVVLAVGDSGGA